MLFDLTYALNADDIEVEREDMFEHEQAFSFHEAEAPRVVVYTAHLGRNRLCRVLSTGHTISLKETDCISILLPRHGRLVVETVERSFSAGPGDMLLFTPNMRVTHVVPGRVGRFECDCALIAYGDAIESPEAGAISVERRFNRTAASRKAFGLWRFVDHLFDEGFEGSSGLERDRAKDAANVLLTETLGQLLEEELKAAPAHRLPSPRDHQLVRAAEELMRERYSEALSTREIAKCIGVSARRVQIAFGNARSASPLSVLKAIRLELARQRILDSANSESITQIAIECGFFHHGRFSRDYSGAFGETPSRSLRRVRP